MFSLYDIQAMAQECANQKSGELSVADLATGVYYARQQMNANFLNVNQIAWLGYYVEPQINHKGFRTLPVFIDGKMAGVNPDNIETALKALCEAYNEGRITRAELYQEFETIHPFADGNGRVGFVLYNLTSPDFSDHLEATPAYIKS